MRRITPNENQKGPAINRSTSELLVRASTKCESNTWPVECYFDAHKHMCKYININLNINLLVY